MNSMGIMSDKAIDLKRLKTCEEEKRKIQDSNFNRRYRTRERSPLLIGQQVKVSDGQNQCEGTVVATRDREVAIAKDNGNLLRRNRVAVTRKQVPPRDLGSGNKELNIQRFPGVDAPGSGLSPPGVDAPDSTTRSSSEDASENTVRSQGVDAPDNVIRVPSVEKHKSQTSPAVSINVPPIARRPNTPVTKTRSGREVRRPKRLDL